MAAPAWIVCISLDVDVVDIQHARSMAQILSSRFA
jgi:hypothetical protein